MSIPYIFNPLGITPTPDTPQEGKVIGYVVDNAGSSENNGTYNYLDDYNGKPRYEMIDSNGFSLQIYWDDTFQPPGAMGWILQNPGGKAYTAPNSPADSTPENAPWVTGMNGTAPIPTFMPVYDDLTETVKLTVSGIDQEGSPNLVWGSWMNGDYYLVDPAATVKDRVWQHENPDYTSQIKYYDGMWVLTTNSTYTGYSIYCAEGGPGVNPYKSDYSSYSWMREGNSAPNISVIASVVSGESGENTGNIIGYEVDGIGVTAFNGYYGYANDEYNSKPYYTLAASTGGTYYLYYSGDTSGWAIGTTLGGTPLWYQSTVSETPDGGTWTGTASTPPTSITPVYDTTGGGDTGGGDSEGDGGDDSGTTTVAGYRVSRAGATAANGDYLPAGEYGGRTMYQYGSYYLRFNGNENNPGWQITDGSNILYFASGSGPGAATWFTTSYPPVPTVTVIAAA